MLKTCLSSLPTRWSDKQHRKNRKGFQKAESSVKYLGNKNRKLKELGLRPVGRSNCLKTHSFYLHFGCGALYRDLPTLLGGCGLLRPSIKDFVSVAKLGLVDKEENFIPLHWE